MGYCREIKEMGTLDSQLRVICSRRIGIALAGACLSLACSSSAAQFASGSAKHFEGASYALEYPSTWTHKVQKAPDGSELQMFMGPEVQKAVPYCHTTQQPLNPSLALRLAKMSEKQRREFFIANSNQDLLFSLFDNLASAEGFRLVHANAVALNQTTPAFMADFVFRVPQGFTYRVRSHYTFWNKGQLSIWCQAVARTEAASDEAFLRNLADFQRFIASIRITQ
jgi:hypothetical protein